MKSFVNLMSSVFICIIFVSTSTASPVDRQVVIQREIDCINNANQRNDSSVTWKDVCYSSDHAIQVVKVRENMIDEALADASKENQPIQDEEVSSSIDDEDAIQVKGYKSGSLVAEISFDGDNPVDNASDGALEKLDDTPVLPKNQVLVEEPKVAVAEIELDDEGYQKGSLISDVSFDADDQYAVPLRKFELGTEMYDFEYTERIGVKDSGTFYGIAASYTYRISRNNPVHSLQDILSDTNRLNMFRLEGRYATGWVTYEGTGTWDDIRDSVAEVRGLTGYDIQLRSQTRITPFGGIAYRYLFDNFSTVPAQTFEGQDYVSGYDRESNYVYLPIGLEAENKFSGGWNLLASIEYDHLLKGWQKTHLEDSRTLAGEDPGFDVLENDQEDGYGFRGSVRLTKETAKIDFFVEPYFRYWHIKDSEVEPLTVDGALLCTGNLCRAGLEPDNKTKELGVKVGIQY